MGRRLRTKHDLMIPSVQAHVQKKQISMQKCTRSDRQFEVNDAVLVRNFAGLNKWEQGVIAEKLGNRYYMVHVNGTVWKRHVDQIIRTTSESSSKSEVPNIPTVVPETHEDPEIQDDPQRSTNNDVTDDVEPTSTVSVTTDVVPSTTIPPEDSPPNNPRRYPLRARNSPSYLSDYVRN